MRYTNRILWLRIVSTECIGSAKALYVLTSPNNCSTCIQYFAWPINVWWGYSLLGSNVIISSSHEKHPQFDIRRLDLVDSRDIWRGLNQLGSSLSTLKFLSFPITILTLSFIFIAIWSQSKLFDLGSIRSKNFRPRMIHKKSKTFKSKAG